MGWRDAWVHRWMQPRVQFHSFKQGRCDAAGRGRTVVEHGDETARVLGTRCDVPHLWRMAVAGRAPQGVHLRVELEHFYLCAPGGDMTQKVMEALETAGTRTGRAPQPDEITTIIYSQPGQNLTFSPRIGQQLRRMDRV